MNFCFRVFADSFTVAGLLKTQATQLVNTRVCERPVARVSRTEIRSAVVLTPCLWAYLAGRAMLMLADEGSVQEVCCAHTRVAAKPPPLEWARVTVNGSH